MMLLEDSPAVLSLGLFCEEMGNSYESKKGESLSLTKDGKQSGASLRSTRQLWTVSQRTSYNRRSPEHWAIGRE